MRGIQKLIEWNIISKERERREDATWLNNRYVLLDKSVWTPKPSSTEQLGARSQNEPEPSRKSSPNQVAHSYYRSGECVRNAKERGDYRHD